MLYRCGVKTIKYTGKDKFVTDAIKKYKDEDNSDAQLEYPRLDVKYFKMVVFGTDVKLTTMEDWMVSDDEVAKQGDFEDYLAVRLS
jgi:hypothetical protein